MNDRQGAAAFGEIWLGDLLETISTASVGTTTERLAWARELLGLGEELVPREVEAAARRLPSPPPSSQPQALDLAERHIKKDPPARAHRALPYDVVRQSSPTKTASGAAGWYAESQDLSEKGQQSSTRPALHPLFLPRSTRALLSTALATPSSDGEIDIEAIVAGLVQLRPPRSLPRKRFPSTRLGLQLLLDRGAGMKPFSIDRELLCNAIQRVVGHERVDTWYFEDSPLASIDRGDQFEDAAAYRPPAAGTPVVVLTDLGLAGAAAGRFGASTREWLRFARRVRAGSCPLLVLTPYAPERWPSELSEHMHLIRWDRPTSVSTVRRAVGRGLQLKGGV